MLNESIIQVAEYGLTQQSSNGAMPKGSNGPHGHDMTPVRNTAHWAVTFSAAFHLTRNEKFKMAANDCITIILNFSSNDLVFSFHRFPSSGTIGNGLIGQMWVAESMILCSFFLKNNDYLKVGKSILEHHAFNENECLWYESSYQNKGKLPNNTLNQQIWVAGIWALYAYISKEKLNYKVSLFVDRLFESIDDSKDFFPLAAIQMSKLNKMKLKAYTLKHQIKFGFSSNKQQIALIRDKELGYHSFCLIGLAYILLSGKKLTSVQEYKLRKKIAAIDEAYAGLVINSKFGSTYNVCGFELDFIRKVMPSSFEPESLDVCNGLYEHQCQLIFNSSAKLKSYDDDTLTARSYELTRSLIL